MNGINEKALVEQLLRIINSNYSDFYAIDIPNDKYMHLSLTNLMH
jgi:hypothetical protein